MSLLVRTTHESDAQIREIDDWWRNNRPAAPDLFLQELAATFDVIGHAQAVMKNWLTVTEGAVYAGVSRDPI